MQQRIDVAVDGRRHPVSGFLPYLQAVQSYREIPAASWHAHDYRQRPPDRTPTPHLIRNILGLDESSGASETTTVLPQCLDPSSTCSALRGSAAAPLVSSSSVGPDDERRFGSRRGHAADAAAAVNGLDWSTSGRRAAHLGNSLATSSAADTTLRGNVSSNIYNFISPIW